MSLPLGPFENKGSHYLHGSQRELGILAACSSQAETGVGGKGKPGVYSYSSAKNSGQTSSKAHSLGFGYKVNTLSFGTELHDHMS